MTNVFIKISPLALIALLSASCLPFGDKSALNFKTHPLPEVEEVVPEKVSFEYLKKRILDPQCIYCHEGMAKESMLISWWTVKGKPEESELFLWMEDGSMPPGRPATTKELEIVRRYIEQLAPSSSETEI